MMLFLAEAAMRHMDMVVFFLGLAALMGVARVMGEMMRRIGQPAVLGEILAGIVLGQTLLGAAFPEFFNFLFPRDTNSAIALNGFATLAVTLLLLLAGIEVDLSTVWRQGKSALWVSVTGVVFPFALGITSAFLMPDLMGKQPDGPLLPFALFFGIALAITALPVIAKILMDLNMFKSEMGMLIMSAAMVNDLLGWIGFAFVLALMGHGPTGALHMNLMILALFVVSMLTVGRIVFHRSLPWIQTHSTWPGGVLATILVITLLSAALTEWLGVHLIFGAFIAGVAIGDSNRLRERTRDTIHQFVMNIFAPVFFASIALHVNFVDAFNPWLVLYVLAIAIAGKVFGCYLGASWAGLTRRESWAVGFGMSARGAMEMILAELGRQAGLITEELFVAIVFMAMVTSMLSGPMIQKLLRPQVRRRLPDLLSDRNIILNLKSKTVRSAIRDMADRAAQISGLDATTIAAAVWMREQIVHTGLEKGLAVPHARIESLKKTVVIIAVSEEGIDFDASDGKPAQIICMLLTPATNQTEQLDLLAMVAHTFTADETRKQVIDARTPTEALAVIQMSAAGPEGELE